MYYELKLKTVMSKLFGTYRSFYSAGSAWEYIETNVDKKYVPFVVNEHEYHYSGGTTKKRSKTPDKLYVIDGNNTATHVYRAIRDEYGRVWAPKDSKFRFAIGNTDPLDPWPTGDGQNLGSKIRSIRQVEVPDEMDHLVWKSLSVDCRIDQVTGCENFIKVPCTWDELLQRKFKGVAKIDRDHHGLVKAVGEVSKCGGSSYAMSACTGHSTWYTPDGIGPFYGNEPCPVRPYNKDF